MKRAMFVVAGLIAFFTAAFTYSAHRTELPSETVKILAGTGHGSGFHIGDGYIIAAAHVVGTLREITIKLDDQSEQPATVLWTNKEYDIALVRSSSTMRAAPLVCRIPYVHELIYAQGNPLHMEFLRTWGRVAGGEATMGPWKSAVPVDMTIVMGMSGGPVFDVAGNIIGVNVGVTLSQFGITGIGVIVPAKSVCELLARS